MTDFNDFEWVVWRLEVEDSSQLAGEDPGLDERTQETMTELAASLGCVYEHCVDTDTYSDGTPYYTWWVRLPAAEHARLDKDGLPQAIGPLRKYLTTQLPDGLKWQITPDREYTLDHAGSVAMRTAYDDLIAPFERALMPLRGDGADALDPRAKDTWGVISVAYDGPPAASRRPCAGEEPCPWRRDAPPGQFPAQAFVHSAPGNRTGAPTGRFGCHSSTPTRPLLCAGWLLAGADGNADVLDLLRSGTLPMPELPDGTTVYGSYAEMAIANGVDPALPALYPHTPPADDEEDFLPLNALADIDDTPRPARGQA